MLKKLKYTPVMYGDLHLVVLLERYFFDNLDSKVISVIFLPVIGW